MSYQPGEVFVAHAPGAGSVAISLGEHLSALRHPSKLVEHPPPWHWTHAGLVVDADGTTVEALAQGVVRSNMAAHPTHVLLRCPPGVDRTKAVASATSMLGWSYNWGDLVVLGVDTFTGATLADADAHRVICSQLVALALMAGGWAIPDGRPAARVMPSDLYRWLA